MRLILIGPPGSGKGTQAKLLCDRLGLAHFSTGDILRDAIEKDTPEGRRAKTFMNAGQLAPDDLVNDIVRARFRTVDRPEHFVMDGYPRNLAQALFFDGILKESRLPLSAAIYLNVEDVEIVRRLGQRWTCANPGCSGVFNAASIPPAVPGKCDVCESDLYQRDDDKPETIRKRLQLFHDLHDAIVRHYQEQGLLIEVKGQGDIEAIYTNVLNRLGVR